MSLFRALVWFVPALLVVVAASVVVTASNEPAHAWRASKLFATDSHPLIVKIEGRKGTRLYRPDDSEDYDALVEGQEKAAAAHEPTVEEKLDQCMASWDDKTHITKSSWRNICEREIKNNE